MEIKTFEDSRGNTIEVHVNMGRELNIYQKYGINSWLNSEIGPISLRAAKDSLAFCEGCLATTTRGPGGAPIVERSITYRYVPADLEDWEDDSGMIVTTTFHVEPTTGNYVSIKNSFRVEGEPSYRSEIRYLRLESLREAIAWGEECWARFNEMMARARIEQKRDIPDDPFGGFHMLR